MVSVRSIPILHFGTSRKFEHRCCRFNCISSIRILPAICVWFSTFHRWRRVRRWPVSLGCQCRRFVRWGRGFRFPFSSKGKRCPSREAASSCHFGLHAEVVELGDALSKRQFWNFWSTSIVCVLEISSTCNDYLDVWTFIPGCLEYY